MQPLMRTVWLLQLLSFLQQQQQRQQRIDHSSVGFSFGCCWPFHSLYCSTSRITSVVAFTASIPHTRTTLSPSNKNIKARISLASPRRLLPVLQHQQHQQRATPRTTSADRRPTATQHSTLLPSNSLAEPSATPVRRLYETWEWTYDPASTNNRNVNDNRIQEPKPNRTYRINYRMEKASNSNTEKENKKILLVHGFGANVNHFRYQIPALVAAGYDVYAIDLLGFGASEKPLDAANTGFSIELFVQQIIDFLSHTSTAASSFPSPSSSEQTITASQQQQQLQASQSWILAGNSIGGLCCLGVAAALEKDPTLQRKFCVDSIVLFNTSGGMTGFRYSDAPVWARPLLAFVQYVILGPVCGGYFFRNFKSSANIERILKESGVYRDTTNVNPELLEILLVPADDPGAEAVFLAVFGGPAGPTAESILPDVKVPVLALWGQDDPWTPIDTGLHPGRALPPYHGTGEFVLDVIPNAGHCPHDECPEIVNVKMLEFLKTRTETDNDNK